jgi:glycerol-3-phosphate dehydrogenase
LGLLVNDLLSLDRNRGLYGPQRLPAGRMISRDEVLARLPGLPAQGLAGAAHWHDAQVESSERLTVAFLRAAVERRARVANHCEATLLLREGGRVTGARVRDRETGEVHEVRARVVLNAAGPGAERLLRPLGVAPLGPLLEAANLVFEGPWPLGERLGVGVRSRGRFLFLVPWRDHILAGTEYWPAGSWPGGREIDVFRAEVARAFPWAGLEGRRLSLVHRGFVPGSPEGPATRPRFVDHEATGGPAGLITVQGVKYTTARAVSAQAAFLASCKLGLRMRIAPPEPLAWARPLPGTLAERARQAVGEEMAMTLADAVLRRLDLGTAGPPAEAEVEEVGMVMAEERGWGASRLAAEKAALARFYEAAYNGTSP